MGLRVGDKLRTIDGFDMSLPSGRGGYFEHLHSKKPGDRITVLIQRGENQIELTMKLPNP